MNIDINVDDEGNVEVEGNEEEVSIDEGPPLLPCPAGYQLVTFQNGRKVFLKIPQKLFHFKDATDANHPGGYYNIETQTLNDESLYIPSPRASGGRVVMQEYDPDNTENKLNQYVQFNPPGGSPRRLKQTNITKFFPNSTVPVYCHLRMRDENGNIVTDENNKVVICGHKYSAINVDAVYTTPDGAERKIVSEANGGKPDLSQDYSGCIARDFKWIKKFRAHGGKCHFMQYLEPCFHYSQFKVEPSKKKFNEIFAPFSILYQYPPGDLIDDLNGDGEYEGEVGETEEEIQFENALMNTARAMWRTLHKVASTQDARVSVIVDIIRVWQRIPAKGEYKLPDISYPAEGEYKLPGISRPLRIPPSRAVISPENLAAIDGVEFNAL